MKNGEENPLNKRDDVATLVRLAGKRKAVPRERAERVRAAAQEQWQREVRRRSRRRRLWLGGLATAATLLLAMALRILSGGGGVPLGPQASILVESLIGPAWLQSAVDAAAPARALVAGEKIPFESALTTENGGRTAIRLASGHSVRLDGSTSIRLLEAGSIALDKGAIYVDSGLDSPGAKPLVIHTPLGRIDEIGTQFEIRLAHETLRVRLREGAVIVRHDGQTHDLQAGYELKLAPDGSVTRREVPTYGTEWDWIVGIAPTIDLEGRSARAFLEWVARERGWTLAFADAAVARSADEIELSGTVERLTLDQALDAVLPACRMIYRVEKGVLVIASEPAA